MEQIIELYKLAVFYKSKETELFIYSYCHDRKIILPGKKELPVRQEEKGKRWDDIAIDEGRIRS